MAATNQGPRRIGQWLYLRPECIDAYKKCHAAVWPEVLEQIKDSHIEDCASVQSTRAQTRNTNAHRLHLPQLDAPPDAVRQLQVHRQCVRRGYEAHGREPKGAGVVAHDRWYAGESCRGRGGEQGWTWVVGADRGGLLRGVIAYRLGGGCDRGKVVSVILAYGDTAWKSFEKIGRTRPCEDRRFKLGV